MELRIIARHCLHVRRPFLLHVASLLWLSWQAIFFLVPATHSSEHAYGNNETDRLTLLSFKSMISNDPFHALASWNTSLHFCRWHGIVCEGRGEQQRVVALSLTSLSLAGSISPSIANLTFLQKLVLSQNELHGPIPRDIGFLAHLQELNLSYNVLQGEIPSYLGQCLSLSVLDLGINVLTGIVPRSLGILRDLTHLRLDNNRLEAGDWSFLPALINCSNLRILTLENNTLYGMLPSSVANLSTQLEALELDLNQISGNIPLGIGKLFNLQTLDWSDNQLSGPIPPSLANLSALTWLNLANNSLTGKIPTYFCNLNSLNVLVLSANQLMGSIPPCLGNLSALNFLYLNENNLMGEIPPSLGSFSNLLELSLGTNFLSGVIPSSLWNLSSLEKFGIYHNNLFGALPHDMGYTLNQLNVLLIYENKFHGLIPMSLSNASTLQKFEANSNKFSGNIPESLGKLQELSKLILTDNELGEREATDWSFLTTLTNNTSLKVLDLHGNKLGGSFPKTIANLSTSLEWLDISGNYISRAMPTSIGQLVNLENFALNDNLFDGPIPATIGMLKELRVLDLSYNQFSGEIPPSLGNLTKLIQLGMGNNYFNGSVPAILANCRDLLQLTMENNELTGTIPIEIFSIPTLSVSLDLANNLLEGSLPLEVGNLHNLIALDISKNKLSGVIPDSLSECQALQSLFMGDNMFHGHIPDLYDLKGLQQLDLSHNNLDGPIPEFLGSLPLIYLNLSFNELEGEVPAEGVFANVSAISVLGNTKLCGGNPKLHLPPCKGRDYGKKKWSSRQTIIAIVVVVAIFFSILLLISCILIHWKCKSRRESAATAGIKEHMKLSYAELVKATNGFSSVNLIGTGSFGTVYKGILEQSEQRSIAVKVLNLQQPGASRSFIAECETLRNIRHRNLVKILTSCSTIDFRGNDFKALVFEFLPNGSLEKWLHPDVDLEGDRRKLSLGQRLNIAIDVASAVEYLHHHHPMPIVHCDLKPSNVLLDDDMTAHVGDFGLARFLSETQSGESRNTSSSIQLKGSIGYVAPEYGIGSMVSTLGDIYSFGILLLEMFTGRRPTDDAFHDGTNLRNFVEKALPNRVVDIVDPFLLLQEEDGEASVSTSNISCSAGGNAKGCLLSLLTVGTRCSKESPMERMQIGEVTRELYAIRNELQQIGIRTR